MGVNVQGVQTLLLFGKGVAGTDVGAVIAANAGVLAQNRLAVGHVVLLGIVNVAAVAAHLAVDVLAVAFIFVGVELDGDPVGFVNTLVLDR